VLPTAPVRVGPERTGTARRCQAREARDHEFRDATCLAAVSGKAPANLTAGQRRLW
jgi:hypothetical protein